LAQAKKKASASPEVVVY